MAVAVAAAMTMACASRASADPAPAAVAAELTGDGSSTSLLVTLSGPAPVSTFLLENPDRAVVDLGTDRIRLEELPAARGLVRSIRYGAVSPGRSRLVLDLAGPAVVAGTALQAGPVPGTSVLAVELRRAPRDLFRRSMAAPLAEPVTTGSLGAVAARSRSRPVIAIDAGHGGSDRGAASKGGTLEKDLTLAFARSLRDSLGAYDVLMIRDDDVFVPLDERVRRARAGGAALLISIHADFIARPGVAGATVYTGAERATDGESARLADRENAADRTGPAAPGPPAAVLDILHDLTARETRGFSHRFARTLLGQLGPVMRLNVEPHREAGFRVLRAADIPAVLVELGYLSNEGDARLMVSEAWRRRTTDAMARAVDRFFGAPAGVRAAVSP